MLGIIEYGSGNLFSLKSALERLSIPYGFVHNKHDMELYDGFIIPGVGNAGVAVEKLYKTDLALPLIKTKKKVLGICLGMQLLTKFSEEAHDNLLGIIPLITKQFRFDRTSMLDYSLKIPHMGWNNLVSTKESPILKNIPSNSYFYFVHSYYIELDPRYTIGKTEYGIFFSSLINFENFWGVQFHPEKSGAEGEKLLQNFYEL